MGRFVCDNCHSVENTSYGTFHGKEMVESLYVGVTKGTCLCSACTPTQYASGRPTRFGGKWHKRFSRRVAVPADIRNAQGVGHMADTQGARDVVNGVTPKITFAEFTTSDAVCL